MGKKFRNLYQLIHERKRLWEAYRLASLGKKESYGYLLFRMYEAANIEGIIKELEEETYHPEKHNEFYVFEPKPRKISALPFLDRVIQHSLSSVILPIFEKTFLPYSFACRDGKGTHAGAKYVQSVLRKEGSEWALKVDFKGYFYNIDRKILWKEIDKKIYCEKTKRLIEKFHPREGKGLPIGNLTSQLLANIYGHKMDMYLTHEIKAKYWARYMDDTIVFGSSREELEEIFKKLTIFATEEMNLEWSKWSIRPTKLGVNFLGYRIWATHKLIRKDSVKRAKKKIKQYTKHNETEKLNKFKASWSGHIKWADSHNLKRTLLGG